MILEAIIVVCALCVGLARLHSESNARVLPKLANTLENLALTFHLFLTTLARNVQKMGFNKGNKEEITNGLTKL